MNNPHRETCRGTHYDEESDVCIVHAAWGDGFQEGGAHERARVVAWLAVEVNNLSGDYQLRTYVEGLCNRVLRGEHAGGTP